MERRENQRVMLTKRLIRESLIRLMVQESVHKISIRMLCEDAGVNRSTFYKYYGSQYDVLAEVEAEFIAGIQDTLEDGDNSSASSARKLNIICAYIEQNISLVKLLIDNNITQDFPTRLFRLPQIRATIADRLAGRYDSESQDYIYAFLINGCYQLIQEWLKREDRKPFTQVALLMQELIDRICGAE
ncbi:TetR/AcrR family transcriptional regulator [Lawsonibacter celer]|uniref:TetR/AcrR family transcriptional regulator n=1 Tax=Lawsonibacter celer TaxID=2986526 RepID=UPI001648E8E1|nr:TetR/AcrR family transcriptional regulator [Lawsonibacter celer]